MTSCMASMPSSTRPCWRRALPVVPERRMKWPHSRALIIGSEGGYITGSDFLIDGGATANFYYGPDAKPTS